MEKKDTQGRVGTVLAGRYRILKLLGEGAQGAVYVGEHLKIGRKDAIKVLQPALLKDADAVARFTRGASKASHINHPNVCTVYDFGETEEGLPFMASELVAGSELHDVIRNEAPLPLERAVDLLEQIAAGLNAAHQLDIVHRDLKPANVMLTRSRDGREVVKVVDFDIAKGIGEKETGGDLTQAGWIIGTPQYMSPEQITAEELDGRSDTYSLALIFFEMITGALPNERGNTQKLMWERVSGDLRGLRDVRPDFDFPPALQRALDRALASKREDRPATAVEFAREVRQALENPDPTAGIDPEATAAMTASSSFIFDNPTLETPAPVDTGATRIAPAGDPTGSVPPTRASGTAAVPPTRAAETSGVPPTQAAPPTTAEERNTGRRKKGPAALGTAVAGVAGLGIAGLAFAWSQGMIGGGGASTLSVPGPVEMEIGQSRELDVRLFDARGEAVADASIGFTTRDARVASVDADGTVFAGAAGAAVILVRAGELVDSVHVTVLTPITGDLAADGSTSGEGDAAGPTERTASGDPGAAGPRSGTGGERTTAAPPRDEGNAGATPTTPTRSSEQVYDDLTRRIAVVSEDTPRSEIEALRDEALAVLRDGAMSARTRARANWVHAQALDRLGESPATWCRYANAAVQLDPGVRAYEVYAQGCREPSP